MKRISEITYIYDKDLLQKARILLLNVKARNHTYTDNILLDSFHSATIEGARTTIEQVRKSLINPKTKSDKMVANNVKVLNYVYNGTKITDDNIRQLWEMLVQGCCENEQLAGTKYRSGMVYVSSATEIIHVPAKPDEIQTYMTDLFNWIYTHDNEDTLIKAIVGHIYFVYIHPFCDGNGRMARILMNSILYQSGYTNVKYLNISNSIRMHLSMYYNTITLSEHSDMNVSPFIDYMLRVIIHACEEQLKQRYELNDKEKILISRIKTDITVKKAAQMLNTSEAVARDNLNKLTDKCLLVKRKEHGKSIYSKPITF